MANPWAITRSSSASFDAGFGRHRLDTIREDRGESAASLPGVDRREPERTLQTPRAGLHNPDEHVVRLRPGDATAGVTGTPNRLDADGGERAPGVSARNFELARGQAGGVVHVYDEWKLHDEERSKEE